MQSTISNYSVNGQWWPGSEFAGLHALVSGMYDKAFFLSCFGITNMFFKRIMIFKQLTIEWKGYRNVRRPDKNLSSRKHAYLIFDPPPYLNPTFI